MMISRLEALFWLQFFLVVIGVSHQLTVNFLLVPLFIGLLLFANLVLKRLFVIDRVFIFFSVLFVGYFVRCVLAETFMQINFVQESSMIISGYALVNAFQNLKFSIFSTRLAYSLILITTLYFIATYAIGIPALESVSYIFLSGSYHIVTWLCLLTIGLYEVFSRKPRLTIYVVFFVMSLLLGGRSGIVISFLLLSVKFLLNNKRSGKSALLVSKWFLFLLITFFIWDYELYKVGDLLFR